MWFLVIVLALLDGQVDSLQHHFLIPVPARSQTLCEDGAETALESLAPPDGYEFKDWYCVYNPKAKEAL